MRRFFIFLIPLFVILSDVVFSQQTNEVAKIQKLIEDNGMKWIADQTSMMGIPLNERKGRLGLVIPENVKRRFAILNDEPPPSLLNSDSIFDWRESGMVSAVKNQGSCGSCWAFAATAAFEAAYMIANLEEPDFSEQQVLSCNGGGSSCSGGWMEDAYLLFRNFGAVDESCMPYEADDTVPCTQDDCTPVDTILAFYDIASNVNAIKNAVVFGPVSTTMTVYDDFYAYTGGCYEHEDIDPLNHAVLIVGWDDTMCDGEGAWIIKNSWGTGWGLNGYFYIKYNSSGIGNYTQFPCYLSEEAPQLTYSPDEYVLYLESGVEESEVLELANIGSANLIFDLSAIPARDSFGYYWRDSNWNDGPEYGWIDISTVGQVIDFGADLDNGNSGPLPLGFDFIYYGIPFHSISVCTNGWGSFSDHTSNDWDNVAIPDPASPNNLLAVFFDDLNFVTSGTAYFYTNDTDSAVITWQDVPDEGLQGEFTFQIVLVAPSTIVFQYDTMGPNGLDQSTIGIENASGTVGLQVAHNEFYIHDSLSIEFYLASEPPPVDWISLSQTYGFIYPGDTTRIDITFNAGDLNDGIHRAFLRLACNDYSDPDHWNNLIPVTLVVNAPECHYVVGDANGDGSSNGLDVVYLVGFLKGGTAPSMICECPPHGEIYAACDVNGSCAVNGLDVTYMVSYLKGGPDLLYCEDCSPR